jgi:hypothetical protein
MSAKVIIDSLSNNYIIIHVHPRLCSIIHSIQKSKKIKMVILNL